MIFDLIEIFKARKDPAVAAKLGSRFTTGMAFERLSFPVLFVKFWMTVGMAICALLIGLFLYGAYKVGWGAGLPVLIPLGVAYVIFRIWLGINKGLERVKLAAQNFTDASIDNVGAKIAARKSPT